MLSKWERKILLDKLHGLDVNPSHLRAVKVRAKRRMETAFRDLQLILTVFPDVQQLVRGVGFEPTNPFGSRSQAGATRVAGFLAGSGGIVDKVLPDVVTRRDYMTAPSFMRDTDWQGYLRFLRNEGYSHDHFMNNIRYVHRYGHVLFSGDLSELLTLSPNLRRHVLAALTSLAKYLGRYEEFKRLREKYGIKVERKTRITPKMLEADMRELAWWLLKAREILGLFIDFCLATGMRRKEAIDSYNLIIKLNKEDKLDQYYNDGFLEHFRYEDTFCRRGKNVYVSYCPPEIVTRVAASKPLTVFMIEDRLADRGLKIRIKEIRVLWASYMSRYLTQPEIDLLQGRVGKSIFMQHYFNPNYVPDLKKRLEQGVKSLFLTIQSMAEAK